MIRKEPGSKDNGQGQPEDQPDPVDRHQAARPREQVGVFQKSPGSSLRVGQFSWRILACTPGALLPSFAAVPGSGVSFCLDLDAIAEAFEVVADGGFEFRGLGELGVQLGDEARHLFLERFAVVLDFLDFLGTDVATGR